MPKSKLDNFTIVARQNRFADYEPVYDDTEWYKSVDWRIPDSKKNWRKFYRLFSLRDGVETINKLRAEFNDLPVSLPSIVEYQLAQVDNKTGEIQSVLRV